MFHFSIPPALSADLVLRRNVPTKLLLIVVVVMAHNRVLNSSGITSCAVVVLLHSSTSCYWSILGRSIWKWTLSVLMVFFSGPQLLTCLICRAIFNVRSSQNAICGGQWLRATNTHGMNCRFSTTIVITESIATLGETCEHCKMWSLASVCS